MTPYQIQQKIFYGYAKAGLKLGATFGVYRSSTPINPINEENFIVNLNASMSVSWDYMKASKYGNSIFNCCIDAQDSNFPNCARVGDYLVPVEDTGGHINDKNTYFVQSLQLDLPPIAVSCNDIISIVRPNQSTDAGSVGYVGYLPNTSDPVITNMPASILKSGISNGRSYDQTRLPTDTKEPMWQILIPNLGNVEIRVGDIVTDQFNEDFVVMINELTDLGWRLQVMQSVNSR